MRRGFLALSVLASLPACSDSSTEFWQPVSDLMSMVALDDRVAFVERTSATAFLLDPGDASLKPRLVSVGQRPVKAVKHTGSNRLLVVSAGDRGSSSKPPVSPQLRVVDPSAPTPEPPLSHELENRFDDLEQSSDGRFAILYHKSSSQDANDGALFNPNDLAVADFSEAHTAEPTLTPKSIRSLGGVPDNILFSPEYGFPSAGLHRFAVVLSQNYLTLVDLYDVSHTEISIPLCPSTSSCSYKVEDMVFDPSNLGMYVRVTGTKDQTGVKDIFQITLTDTGAGDFRASLSMLAVGAAPADMVLYGVAKQARLAVVAPDTKALVIIDPNTSSSVSVSMAIPANTIVPFDGGSRAMLVDLGRGSTSVLFADFGVVQTAGGLPLSQYSIRGAATKVDPLISQGIALLWFGKSAGSAVLSVVSLTQPPSFFDYSSSSALGTPTLEVRDLASRLWSVDSPSDGLPAPNSGLHYLDVVAGASQNHPTTIWLDQTIRSLTALAKPSSDGKRYLVLGHDLDNYGNLTFVDANSPDRATARTAYGFLLTDYLGRTQP
jgi:hypothetical protein